MEKTEIQFRNFKPRETVEEKSQELIHGEIQDLTENYKFKASIVDQGQSFHISVMAKNSEALFNSESQYYKKSIWGYPRLWQIKALIDVVRDLTRQIRLAERMKKLFGKETRNEIKEN